MRLIVIVLFLLPISAFARQANCEGVSSQVEHALESTKIISSRPFHGDLRSRFTSLMDNGLDISPAFFKEILLNKRFQTSKFDVRSKNQDHVQEHMESLQVSSVNGYKRKAHAFANSSDENIISYRSANEIYRFNPVTNEYMIINRGGKNIETYFIPNLEIINRTRVASGEPKFNSITEWFVRNKWERHTENLE